MKTGRQLADCQGPLFTYLIVTTDSNRELHISTIQEKRLIRPVDLANGFVDRQFDHTIVFSYPSKNRNNATDRTTKPDIV